MAMLDRGLAKLRGVGEAITGFLDGRNLDDGVYCPGCRHTRLEQGTLYLPDRVAVAWRRWRGKPARAAKCLSAVELNSPRITVTALSPCPCRHAFHGG